ncbi:TetR/AcrR family transcriptional regulator [Rhodococcus triatomae]|uniref:DNA-binding transcriptional regulator, AcrR family n=1 Tax=Rhodococcus triatomae TaxID=300028 RepID=A0A1G8I9Q4_9NOCA|nr:TetR/AcrR family transcriptional regulator [Rhodococcus triatomae]QNG20995.1 TetR/AcrR family transcriptional regulator [Rhodococcus triatomae]QNG23090.1 TetR/AcrR family transcriptional regulator [Rhodococcus triatomae]SDI15603.1 DNA-binding transcriptional regulator, AcrR family [Rhodococcus triatomae]
MRERRYSSTSPELLAAALFDVAAAAGLDNTSVREVAKKAGVSIGAVQHHFATKESMFAYALRAVVDRIHRRIATVHEADAEQALVAMLGQLLPLDEDRAREAHVLAAFSVRAATTPSLATIRRQARFAVRTLLSSVLIESGVPDAEARAALLLSCAEGLALAAVGAPEDHPAVYLTRALELQVRMTLWDADADLPPVELAS